VSKLSKGRILIVDDDPALLGLLQTLLEEAGCAVETIEGANGFTPQLMALSRPSLVLLNPLLSGLDRGLLKAVVTDFRRASRAPVVLFANLGEDVLARHSQALGADGFVPIRALLEDPLAQLRMSSLESSPSRAASGEARAKHVSELSEDDILTIDLGQFDAMPQAHPRPTDSRPSPSSSTPSLLASQLFNAIEEEVSTLDVVEGVEHYDVALDVMSEANLYTNATGQVTGIFVPSSVPPDEGRAVDVTVRFPWGGEMTCEATVEWNRSVSYLGRRNKGGFGARFSQFTPENVALVQRFLRLRAPVQAPPKRGV